VAALNPKNAFGVAHPAVLFYARVGLSPCPFLISFSSSIFRWILGV